MGSHCPAASLSHWERKAAWRGRRKPEKRGRSLSCHGLSRVRRSCVIMRLMKSPSSQALEPYRVLDLTQAIGWTCGKLLADLGADVIKIEPPGGDPGRRFGPFYQDDPHPERSLPWLAAHTNKRSITLSLDSADGEAL